MNDIFPMLRPAGIYNSPSEYLAISVIDLEKRFWKKVGGCGDECWIWQSAANIQGYGLFRCFGRQHGAHRIAYMLTKGTVPSHLVVRHTCDAPACCNPTHLILGTKAQNTRDMYARGRGNPHGNLNRIRFRTLGLKE